MKKGNQPTLQKDYVKNVEKNPEPGIGTWNVTKKRFVDNLPVECLYFITTDTAFLTCKWKASFL